MTNTFLAILLAIAGIGLFMVVQGWRRRVDIEHRFCRRCGYRVDPTEHVDGLVRICSECGQPLSPAKTRMGRRQPNRWMTGIGAAALLFSSGVIGTWVYGTFEGYNWMRLLPSWYLLRTDITQAASYGTSHVDILRERYVDGDLSPSASETFADLLARRATDMFADPNITVVRFSGITLHALQNHTPDPEVVEDLLDALVAFEVNESAFVVEIAPNGTAILWRPPLIYLPNHFSFDMSMSYRSLIGRLEINSLRDIDGTPVTIFEHAAPTHLVLDTASWSGEPLVLDCTITWVFDADPLPDAYDPRLPRLNPHIADRDPWWTTSHEITIDRVQTTPYVPRNNELRSW